MTGTKRYRLKLMEENVLGWMFHFTRFNSTITLNVKEESEHTKTQNDKYQARPSKSNGNVLVTPLCSEFCISRWSIKSFLGIWKIKMLSLTFPYSWFQPSMSALAFCLQEVPHNPCLDTTLLCPCLPQEKQHSPRLPTVWKLQK